MTRADPLDPQRIEHYRNVFHIFARDEAPGLNSPIYAELSYGVSLDDDLLAVAAQKRKGQPAPNILFAAVQYLLLSGVDHPLAAHYPIVSGAERPPTPAFPLFRDFVLTHRDAVLNLVRTRNTQTNVVRRCACLLPAFSIIAREADAPLALLDLGASAGLNLNFDRYAYRYERAGRLERRWGTPNAAVQLECDLRGPGALPDFPEQFQIAARIGIDLNPINLNDPDQLRWLQALIWPEHIERHDRLRAAAAELETSPVHLHQGDAAQLLPQLLTPAPPAPAPAVPPAAPPTPAPAPAPDAVPNAPPDIATAPTSDAVPAAVSPVTASAASPATAPATAPAASPNATPVALPNAAPAVPPDAALVVYATVALYQFGAERIAQIERALQNAARQRPIWLVALEGRQPQLTLTRYHHANPTRQTLATTSPHGWWMQWTAPTP